ncbi:hypothetical protein ACQ9ZF_10960 (plasmid) [Cetobacterium somerae]|uniref:hypothetical protein n=1 Tax=Cetobacterium somerae TaxID=188913 RepID=UPI003D7699B7
MITMALLGLIGVMLFFIGKLSIILVIICLCFWGLKVFIVSSAVLFLILIFINLLGGGF